LCPDEEILKDVYKLKNGYTNLDERKSFSLSINKCNKDINTHCKSDKIISKLL